MVWQKTESTTERFWRKVNKTKDCWNWIGAVNDDGYGVFWYVKQNILAHRVSYIIAKGIIPEGMLVCHTCDNRICVYPEHFFIGTHDDNLKDMVKKGRSLKGDRHPTKHNPSLIKRADENGNSKYTWDIVKEIRHEYYELNYTYRMILEKFEISRGSLEAIIQNRHWVEDFLLYPNRCNLDGKWKRKRI